MKNIIKAILLYPAILPAGEFIDKQSMGNTSYLNARYLNHNLGRFLNQDVLQEYNGHYSYQKGDVILFSDPTGLGVSGDEGDIAEEILDTIFTEKDLPAPKEKVTKEHDKSDPADAKDTNSVIDAGSSGLDTGHKSDAYQIGYDTEDAKSRHIDPNAQFKAVPNLAEPEVNTPDESYRGRKKKKIKVKSDGRSSESAGSGSGSGGSGRDDLYSHTSDSSAGKYSLDKDTGLGSYDEKPRYQIRKYEVIKK
ncbi:hypothetical protein BJAS_P3419 [Bathymodiolus japonicus methanotrophic gill symbiont]|nr:hypothetical protein BJAS_P3419 [Bathymodiolus japonicus methanotrophic gill symbiont]